jgi:hypothetical protein
MAQHEFAADQRAALAAVASLLADMSGEKNAALWTDNALARLTRWHEVRARANGVANLSMEVGNAAVKPRSLCRSGPWALTTDPVPNRPGQLTGSVEVSSGATASG